VDNQGIAEILKQDRPILLTGEEADLIIGLRYRYTILGGPMKNVFFAGFIRLHILYHAYEGTIFGLGILRELHRHGYELSPGTLYPLLHRMEEQGLLKSENELVTGKIRRVYRITESGRQTLLEAREKVRELFGELFSQESLVSLDRRQTEKNSEES